EVLTHTGNHSSFPQKFSPISVPADSVWTGFPVLSDPEPCRSADGFLGKSPSAFLFLLPVSSPARPISLRIQTDRMYHFHAATHPLTQQGLSRWNAAHQFLPVSSSPFSLLPG